MGVQIDGSQGNVIATKGTYSGNVTIGGTLTYEDVTNIDAVGLITARTGVEIGARPGVGASISSDGNMIVSGISTFGSGSGTSNVFISAGASSSAVINFGDTADPNIGKVYYYNNDNSLRFTTNATDDVMMIDSSGRLMQGVTSGRTFAGTGSTKHLIEGTSFLDCFGAVTNSTTAGWGPHIFLGRTRGTSTGSNTVVINNDVVGVIAFVAADGNSFANVARIQADVDGNPGDGDMPGRIVFKTCADGSETLAERLRINSNGYLGVCGYGAPDTAVSIKLTGQVADGTDDASDWGAAGIVNLYNTHGGNAGSEVLLLGSQTSGVGQISSGFGFGRSNGSDWATYISFKTHGANTSNIDEITERLHLSSTELDFYDTSGAGDKFPLRLFNADTTSGNMTAMYFGPCNNVAGAYVGGKAEADFTTTANRDAGLRFGVRLNGTFSEPLHIKANGNMLFNVTSTTYSETYSIKNGGDTSGIYINQNSSNDHSGIICRHGRGLSGYSGRMFNFKRNDGTTVGSIDIGASSTAFNTSSDYRLKENQVTIDNASDKVKQLKPYEFNFKDDADYKHLGFFAHEVQEVIPNGVVTGEKDAVDDEGNMKSQQLDYGKLTPLLTAALQEAIAEIETLKAEVAALKSS